MYAQPDARGVTRRHGKDAFVITHRGVIERLGDPYLTDHDRWVLSQFARFLSGRAPSPDPRAVRLRPRPVLYSRVRRATL